MIGVKCSEVFLLVFDGDLWLSSSQQQKQPQPRFLKEKTKRKLSKKFFLWYQQDQISCVSANSPFSSSSSSSSPLFFIVINIIIKIIMARYARIEWKEEKEKRWKIIYKDDIVRWHGSLKFSFNVKRKFSSSLCFLYIAPHLCGLKLLWGILSVIFLSHSF